MSDKQRFEEIIGEIKELLEEAIDLVPEGISRSRAESYWYAHMIVNVSDDHDYMGGSMHSMQDTLEEFDEEDDYDGGCNLPNEGPINDEDWDCEAGRPAHMRDEDWN
tara:strand:+ start:103 stop:423 length:321 start_codon:yes stop_codon:yes gene_type:complete